MAAQRYRSGFWRGAALAVAFLVGGAVSTGAAAQARDCRTIADPAQRLACYDDQAASAAPPAPAAAPSPALADPYRAPTPSAPIASTAPAAPAPGFNPNRTFDSRIAAVSILNDHGFYRVRLENGSLWSTTAMGPPPKVGDAIHHRRTFIGTHYFDFEDRGPLTVRLVGSND